MQRPNWLKICFSLIIFLLFLKEIFFKIFSSSKLLTWSWYGFKLGQNPGSGSKSMYLALDPQHCFLHIFVLLGPIPRSGGWTWTDRSRSSWTNTAGTPHTLHSVLQRRKKHTIYISVVNPDPVGSGIFFTDPELFVLDPDPGKSETKTDT